jgi:tRNA U38,U39,U40 pseudouridine synthase TruA
LFTNAQDVSAVSQVVSFHSTSETLSEESIRASMDAHEAFSSGRLAYFEVKEVPKKFHAMFSATWRRYLYLFPLNTSSWVRNTTPLYDDEPVPSVVYHFSAVGIISEETDVKDVPLQDVDVDVEFINAMLSRYFCLLMLDILKCLINVMIEHYQDSRPESKLQFLRT